MTIGVRWQCNREERTVLSQVRAFLEQHGASRFEGVNSAALRDAILIPFRCGFEAQITQASPAQKPWSESAPSLHLPLYAVDIST